MVNESSFYWNCEIIRSIINPNLEVEPIRVAKNLPRKFRRHSKAFTVHEYKNCDLKLWKTVCTLKLKWSHQFKFFCETNHLWNSNDGTVSIVTLCIKIRHIICVWNMTHYYYYYTLGPRRINQPQTHQHKRVFIEKWFKQYL